MAQDDYFSFGDEELEGELDLADHGQQDPADQAVALLEPPEVDEAGADEDWFESAAKRAARPRGDSRDGSSERRPPSSRRTRVLAALALGLLALILGRAAVSALDGSEPAGQNASTSTARSAAPAAADLEARRRADEIRASRQRAAERQRARQHRAQTRRRARRRRQRVAVERRQRARARRARAEAQEEAAATAEAPATEYVPPTYEPAPPPSELAPEPAPEPPSEPHIHNGASSPEFGL